MTQTVCLDFDGVLHPYSRGWQGPTPDDEPPMPGALGFCTRLRTEGFRLVVSSSRCDTPEGQLGVEEWLRQWGFQPIIDTVTATKPPAVAYVDDRAVAYRAPYDWSTCFEEVKALAAGVPAVVLPARAEHADPDAPCPHPHFEATVEVDRITDGEGGSVKGFSADISVRCGACGEPFRFRGVPCGLSQERPMCSPDESQLRAPIRPASSDPDFGLGIPGFAVAMSGEDEGTQPGESFRPPDDHGMLG